MKVGNSMEGRSRSIRSLMLMGVLSSLIVVSACSHPGWPPPHTSSTSTSPSSSTTLPGGTCDNYTPSQLAISQTTVSAGDSVTISGVTMAGDSVTASLSGGTIGTVALGSATADGNGQFSISAALPTPLAEGTYTVSVVSTSCPTAGTLTLTVVEATSSSCNGSRASRTFHPGEVVNWTLKTASFSTNHPVTVRLIRDVYSYVVYDGPWPTNNRITGTIPMAAVDGAYSIEQTGTKPNGRPAKDTCTVWIEHDSGHHGPYSLGASAQSGSTGQSASVEGVNAERSAVEPAGEVLSESIVLDDSNVPTEVESAGVASESSLPFTGSDALSLTVVAAVLLLAGYSLIRLRRRQAV